MTHQSVPYFRINRVSNRLWCVDATLYNDVNKAHAAACEWDGFNHCDTSDRGHMESLRHTIVSMPVGACIDLETPGRED
jgi:hypothetical protein